jgi:hypothetical protein
MTEKDKATYLYKLRFYQYLWQKHGKAALDDIEEYEISRMKIIWNEIGLKGNRSILALIDELWKKMGSDFEYKIIKCTEEVVQILCTKCPFNDIALENNMKEIVFSTFCMSDYGIVDGFNNKIKFTRTKTLVEDHEYCNHMYEL